MSGAPKRTHSKGPAPQLAPVHRRGPRVITRSVMARKLGRLVAFVFGPAVLAVIFSASPGVPAYGLAAAHPARGVDSSAAGQNLAGRAKHLSQAAPRPADLPLPFPPRRSP